jgi:glycine cleavage system regulatory protein
VAQDGVDALRSAVQAVDAEGLEVRIAPAVEAGDASGDLLHLNLVGQDRPGIVHQVTGILSRLGVNIEDFESDIGVEPHSGGSLFQMDARLRLPGGLAAAEVQAALEAMSAEVMVDISLTSPEGR